METCWRITKENPRFLRKRAQQLRTTVKRQHLWCSNGGALKDESLVLELKCLRSNCMQPLVFKMNGDHSTSEQGGRSNGNNDGA